MFQPSSKWRAGGASFRLERRGKQINPKVIRVWNSLLAGIGFFNLRFVTRDSVRVESLILFNTGKAHIIDIEGGICQDIVERGHTSMRVFVVGVGLLDIAPQPIYRQVHFGEIDCLLSLFLAVNKDAVAVVFELFPMFLDEFRRLYEHAA